MEVAKLKKVSRLENKVKQHEQKVEHVTSFISYASKIPNKLSTTHRQFY